MSADHLGWAVMQEHAAARLSSPQCRERVVAGSFDPLGGAADPAQIGRRFAEVEAFWRAEQAHGRGMRDALADVCDVAATVERARRGSVLDPAALLQVRSVLRAADVLQGFCADDRGPLAELAAAASAVPPLRKRLDAAIVTDPDPGIADDASPALATARREIHSARTALRGAAEALLRRPEVADALADRYWTERDGRVVLPVRADRFARPGRGGAVEGLVHESSGSGQTLFVEPHALIEPGNALAAAKTRARVAEHAVLRALSEQVGAHADAIGACAEALATLDGIAARAVLGRDLDGVIPTVVALQPEGHAVIDLPKARHPLMVLAGTPVVANDLRAEQAGALVLSGPNAGGKTVALKTVGLCVLLARAGVPIPAGDGARVPAFRALVTDVGDDQSIAHSLSTFTAHLEHIRHALQAASEDGAGTLVLLDEIAAGTDPEQGAALAEGILTHLVDAGATVVVTTHYERLKLLHHRDGARYKNGAVGYDYRRLRPTFEVTMGVPGSSRALDVARRLGIPDAVLSRAEAILSDDRLAVDALLRALERERADAAEQRVALESERAAVAAEHRRLQAQGRAEIEAAAARHKQAHGDATRALHRLEEELVRRRRGIEAGGRGGDDGAARKQARRALAEHAPPQPEPTGEPPADVEVGARVFVPGLAATGEVVGIKGERITVAVGPAKTTVARDALRPAAEAKARPRRASPNPAMTLPSLARRHFGSDAIPVTVGFDNVVDLRGSRFDEVPDRIEVFLSQAIEADQEVVVVRHGRGSGAVRTAVREHLPRLDHVRDHRPGLPAEGGDAVTVVWVKG